MPPDVLGIFVKAPLVGRVKTRLAKAIGADAAAALYAAMGHAVVRQCVQPADHSTTVWFAPAEHELLVRQWLDGLGVDGYVAQPDGSLGARLDAAVRQAFAGGAQRVVIIGSDCPEVDGAWVRRAFRALAHADVVFGPALDGGFYLVGLNTPAAGLFDDIAWSTDVVFHQIMANASRRSLATVILPELRDVDTVEDALAMDLLTPHLRSRSGNRSCSPSGSPGSGASRTNSSPTD